MNLIFRHSKHQILIRLVTRNLMLYWTKLLTDSSQQCGHFSTKNRNLGSLYECKDESSP